MFDDSELFDKDDTIVLAKNKIVLQKNNNDKSVSELNKYLKDLDGNWELDINNETTTTTTHTEFVSKHESIIYTIY